jgi:hypothetical protein
MTTKQEDIDLEEVMDEITGAVARGYCHPKNQHKVLDPDLCFAIIEEIRKLLV